jgi:hypothetical protein
MSGNREKGRCECVVVKKRNKGKKRGMCGCEVSRIVFY